MQHLTSLGKQGYSAADTARCPLEHNLSQKALCHKQRPVDEAHAILQVISENRMSMPTKKRKAKGKIRKL